MAQSRWVAICGDLDGYGHCHRPGAQRIARLDPESAVRSGWLGQHSDSPVAVEHEADLRAVPVAELLAAADAGDRAACLELDRRGVEPPMMPLGPRSIVDPPVLGY